MTHLLTPFSISPSELNFNEISVERTLASSFNLQNITEKSRTFKIKTTAPKRYSVRPSIGLLKPGEIIEIKVMMMINKCPPPKPSNDNRDLIDKFQIQSLPLAKIPEPEEETKFLKEVWSAAQKTSIIRQKLNCNYRLPVNWVPPVLTGDDSQQVDKDESETQQEPSSQEQNTPQDKDSTQKTELIQEKQTQRDVQTAESPTPRPRPALSLKNTTKDTSIVEINFFLVFVAFLFGYIFAKIF